jgi:hypothetical protein
MAILVTSVYIFILLLCWALVTQEYALQPSQTMYRIHHKNDGKLLLASSLSLHLLCTLEF